MTSLTVTNSDTVSSSPGLFIKKSETGFVWNKVEVIQHKWPHMSPTGVEGVINNTWIWSPHILREILLSSLTRFPTAAGNYTCRLGECLKKNAHLLTPALMWILIHTFTFSLFFFPVDYSQAHSTAIMFTFSRNRWKEKPLKPPDWFNGWSHQWLSRATFKLLNNDHSHWGNVSSV